MKLYDTAQPYIASYVILRKGEKIAFVLRSNTAWMNGYYGLPSGKVEKNESFFQAAIREAKEEVGIIIKPIDLQHTFTMHRREPGAYGSEWVDVFFEISKWSGDVHNAEPHMHSELAWLDTNKLPKNVIPSVSFALREIGKGKAYGEYGWAKGVQ